MMGLNHTKPFGVQSPEQVAKDYGGNKAKIAHAMQLGIVDPTVGTLAGMFIDRMAAGAQQSQAPQGTVASQVFNPAIPPQQAPGAAGPGGLPPQPGVAAPQPPMPPQSPQAMQPMGPGMAAGGSADGEGGGDDTPSYQDTTPDQFRALRELGVLARGGHDTISPDQFSYMQRVAALGHGNHTAITPDAYRYAMLRKLAQGDHTPVKFDAGGLATLPVPDDMFQETDNQQYKGGGIVAFAEGAGVGDSDGGDDQFNAFKQAIIQQESGGRYGVPNAQGSGALGLVQLMPATAKSYAAKLGMDYRPDLLGGTSPEAQQYQNTLADASLKDDWKFGHGDPALAAGHHFGGGNTDNWGPKTRQYQQSILQKMGQAGQSSPGLGSITGNAGTQEFRSALGVYRPQFAPDTTETDNYIAQLKQQQSPEAQETQRQQDVWAAVANFAKGLGTTPGGFLTGLVAGINDAASSTKDRKALEKQQLLDVSKQIADASNAKQALVFKGLSDAIGAAKDETTAGVNVDKVDAYAERTWANLQKKEDAANAAAAKMFGNQSRGSAIDALKAARKADEDLGKLLNPQKLGIRPPTSDQVEAAASRVNGFLHDYAEAHSAAVGNGAAPVPFSNGDFPNFNRYAIWRDAEARKRAGVATPAQPAAAPAQGGRPPLDSFQLPPTSQ